MHFENPKGLALKALTFEVSIWVECQAYWSIMLYGWFFQQKALIAELLKLRNAWSEWEGPVKVLSGLLVTTCKDGACFYLWAGSKNPLFILPRVYSMRPNPPFQSTKREPPLIPKTTKQSQNITRLECNSTGRNLNYQYPAYYQLDLHASSICRVYSTMSQRKSKIKVWVDSGLEIMPSRLITDPPVFWHNARKFHQLT